MVIMQVNLCWLEGPVKNWRIFLEQSFTAHIALLAAFYTYQTGIKIF